MLYINNGLGRAGTKQIHLSTKHIQFVIRAIVLQTITRKRHTRQVHYSLERTSELESWIVEVDDESGKWNACKLFFGNPESIRILCASWKNRNIHIFVSIKGVLWFYFYCAFIPTKHFLVLLLLIYFYLHTPIKYRPTIMCLFVCMKFYILWIYKTETRWRKLQNRNECKCVYACTARAFVYMTLTERDSILTP